MQLALDQLSGGRAKDQITWAASHNRLADADVFLRALSEQEWHHLKDWSRSRARESRTADQHDAWTVATRLRDADLHGDLDTYLEPCLTPDERKVADIEGWILGVA